MDRGRAFLAMGSLLVLGSLLVGAEGMLLSTPAEAGQVQALRPAFDVVSRDMFGVRAREARRMRRAAPGRPEERRGVARRAARDRTGRDTRNRGRASGHALTGPETALAGVVVVWAVIVIAGRLRRWAARSR
jgi:hypothetical protein